MSDERDAEWADRAWSEDLAVLIRAGYVEVDDAGDQPRFAPTAEGRGQLDDSPQTDRTG